MLLEIPLTFVLSFLHAIFAACYLVWKLPQDGYLAYRIPRYSLWNTKYYRNKNWNECLILRYHVCLTAMNLDEQRYINLLERHQILLP